MVEKDPGNEDGPSLEMPKLGFGFLRRRKQEDQAETEAAAETEEPTADEPAAEEPAAEDVVADESEAADSDPDTIFDEDEQVAEPAEDAEPVETKVSDVVATEEPELADAPPATDTPAIASPAEDLDLDLPDEAPEDEDDAPTPEATSLAKTPDVPSAAEEAPDPDAEATTVLTDVPEADADEATDVLPAEEAPAPAARPERTVSLPALSGLPAAAVTGVAVGLLAVLLTYLGLRGCEQARGTSSCGGPGLFLLIAIMVVCVLAGRFLLRAWNVTDPGSTSFLAVGLLAVIALLFLVNVLFEWWMIILIPLIGLATYMLSHWVTTALIEPADR